MGSEMVIRDGYGAAAFATNPGGGAGAAAGEAAAAVVAPERAGGFGSRLSPAPG